MWKIALGILLACSVGAFSQAPSAPPKKIPAPSSSPPFDPAIVELRKRIAELEKKVEENDQLIWQSLGETGESLSALQHRTVVLDPTEPGGYQRADTSVGPLLISMGKVESYLDGQKVQLKIGNPLAVQYEGFKISAEYGPRLAKGAKWADWRKKIKSKQFDLLQPLSAGKWNPVELIFPDAKPEEFGYLSLSISIDQIGFK